MSAQHIFVLAAALLAGLGTSQTCFDIDEGGESCVDGTAYNDDVDTTSSTVETFQDVCCKTTCHTISGSETFGAGCRSGTEWDSNATNTSTTSNTYHDDCCTSTCATLNGLTGCPNGSGYGNLTALEDNLSATFENFNETCCIFHCNDQNVNCHFGSTYDSANDDTAVGWYIDDAFLEDYQDLCCVAPTCLDLQLKLWVCGGSGLYISENDANTTTAEDFVQDCCTNSSAPTVSPTDTPTSAPTLNPTDTHKEHHSQAIAIVALVFAILAFLGVSALCFLSTNSNAALQPKEEEEINVHVQ